MTMLRTNHKKVEDKVPVTDINRSEPKRIDYKSGLESVVMIKDRY